MNSKSSSWSKMEARANLLALNLDEFMFLKMLKYI
jgi:hypothetical protein